jgi:multiple sugar transport system permease protein
VKRYAAACRKARAAGHRPGRDAWTVQVALSTFTTARTVNLHELFVAAAVSVLPLLLVFLTLQRFIVAGAERTGIDG